MARPENTLRSRLAAQTLRTQYMLWAAGVLAIATLGALGVSTAIESLAGRAAALGGVFAAATLSLHWVGRRLWSPLNELLETAQNIAAGDLSARAPSSDTELGRLGRYFNVMVDRQRVTAGHSDKSRQKLEKLLGSLPLEIALFDSRGCYLFEKLSSTDASDADSRLALGMTPTELCNVRGGAAGVAAEIEQAVAQCIESNEAVTLRGLGGGTSDVRHFVRVFSPVDPSPNDAVRVVGYGVDVSERKAAEEKLRDREEKLQSAQKLESIGRLAGGVAQDFDEILVSMLESVGLALAAEGLPDLARTDLEGVRDSAQRAKVLTGQLLAFGRKQLLRPEVVDVGLVVREAEMMFRRLIGRHIRVDSEHEDEAILTDIDPSKFEQVLMRLVLNARDAMSDGGRLTIKTDVESIEHRPPGASGPFQAGPHAVITIADTGPGMDDATLARIFEPFFTTNTEGSGRGLGLSAVQGTVSQSGGFLTVESEVGVGTTFRVYFPRVGGAPNHIDASDTSPGSLLTAVEGTVVLAAADDLLREFMRRTLERSGFEVLATPDPNEAIDLARDHDGPIELFLADVAVPGIALADVVRVVSTFRPDLRVLPFSTSAGEAMAHQPAFGFVLYLQEPFESDDLVNAVRKELSTSTVRGAT